MKTILIVLGSLILLVIAVVVWLYIKAVRGTLKRDERILDKLAPVTSALEAGATPDPAALEAAARNPETRRLLYESLEAHERSDLFPRRYYTQEALAEGDLVLWLCHPNELGSAPDEIELVETVRRDSVSGSGQEDWYVFRFRMNPPHWAAGDGWMAGVSGPYEHGAEPSPTAPGTFSTFAAYRESEVDKYVDFSSDMLRKKGMA